MSVPATNKSQETWYFTAGAATFTCEGSWSAGVSLQARYNGHVYKALIKDLQSCRNPTAPQTIDWAKCVEWDLLGQGSDQGDILSVVVESDVLVLNVKRQHQRFMVKIGSFKLQLQEKAEFLSSKDEGDVRHLVQTVQEQKQLIEKQRQEISELKLQLEELVQSHSRDRERLVDSMVQLLNQKKQKIHQLQTLRSSSSDPVDTKITASSSIKQESSVDLPVDPLKVENDEAGLNEESDTETTDEGL